MHLASTSVEALNVLNPRSLLSGLGARRLSRPVRRDRAAHRVPPARQRTACCSWPAEATS